MKTLFILFVIFFTYICLSNIVRWIVIKHFLGYIPCKWFMQFKDKETIIIHHNGLAETYCIDEGDRHIDFHNEFKVNRIIMIILMIF